MASRRGAPAALGVTCSPRRSARRRLILLSSVGGYQVAGRRARVWSRLIWPSDDQHGHRLLQAEQGTGASFERIAADTIQMEAYYQNALSEWQALTPPEGDEEEVDRILDLNYASAWMRTRLNWPTRVGARSSKDRPRHLDQTRVRLHLGQRAPVGEEGDRKADGRAL